MNKEKQINKSRRQFMKMMSAGSLVCVGCAQLCADPLAQKQDIDKKERKEKTEDTKHKFMLDSKFSFQQLFAAAYKQEAAILSNLAHYFGKEKFMAQLLKASAEAGAKAGQGMAKQLGKNDFKSYAQLLKKPSYFWQNVWTTEIVEDKANVIEIKVTECLWAQTFKQAGEPEIGYARICHPDFAISTGYNPRMRMERTKTLMEGHSHCNHRWIMEG